MAVIQETIQAGCLVFRRLIGRKPSGQKQKREAKQNITIEEVEKINEKYSERDLQIKLHHNFKYGDIHIVFTYSGEEPSKEQAKEDLKKLKRELRKLYRKHGILLKWIAVTEYENKRIHHHFVLTGGIDVLEISKIWPHGFIRPAFLDNTGDYRKLGNYLIKETSKTFRNDDAVGKRRYSCSRSITMPPVIREEVKVSKLLAEPKPIKGYYIDQDSIYKGVNPITERQYIEYIMVALELEPPRKKFRGKKRKYKKDSADKWIKQHLQYQTKLAV